MTKLKKAQLRIAGPSFNFEPAGPASRAPFTRSRYRPWAISGTQGLQPRVDHPLAQPALDPSALGATQPDSPTAHHHRSWDCAGTTTNPDQDASNHGSP